MFRLLSYIICFYARKTIACGSQRCRKPSACPWRPVFPRGRRSSGSRSYAVRAETPRFGNASSTAARSGASRISSACPLPGSRRPACRSGCSERNAASFQRPAETAALRPDGGRRSGGRRRCNIAASTGLP